jgi:AmiR/NasT family two-component response regulator
MALTEWDPNGILDRAAAARAESARLSVERARLEATFRQVIGSRLMVRTERLDSGRGLESDSARIASLSVAVGRDPSIEEAKRLLADRHGITGAQAFELLRHISQHRNRKLRDIARQVVAQEGARGERIG